MTRVDGTGLPPLAQPGAQSASPADALQREQAERQSTLDWFSFDSWKGLDATITATGRVVGSVVSTANETVGEVKDQANGMRYSRQYSEDSVSTTVHDTVRSMTDNLFDAPRVQPYVDRAPREPADFPAMSGQVVGHVIDHR